MRSAALFSRAIFALQTAPRTSATRLLRPTSAQLHRTVRQASSRRLIHSESSSARFPTIYSNIGYMGDNIINFYAGAPPLNRLSFHRQSTERMEQHLSSPDAKFLVFQDGKPLIRNKGTPPKDPFGERSSDKKEDTESGERLMFLDRKQAEELLGGKTFAPQPADAAEPKYYQSARVPASLPVIVFLGVDDRPSSDTHATQTPQDPQNPSGPPYFALDLPASAQLPASASGSPAAFSDARSAASHLSAYEAGLFAQARAMIDWNTRNKFCAACGRETYSLWAGWKRGCTSVLGGSGGSEPCPSTKGLQNFQYPRTDPVIIMGILNSAGDKILLGRQKSWPKGMYSCLAGFIEPGESFEDAVRREVLEEAGIVVGPVRYSSSQPWPYPSNLMVGCFGQAASGQSIDITLDNELEDARWFSRGEVQAILAHPGGTNIRRDEHKKFENQGDSSGQGQAQVQGQGKGDDQTAAALAPSEGAVAGAEGTKPQDKDKGEVKFRIPPTTAIAGQLVKLWADGGLEATGQSKL